MVDGETIKQKSEKLLLRAIDSFKEKDFDNAELYFQELLSLHPNNEKILENIAITFLENNKYHQAEEILDKIIFLGFKNQKIIELKLRSLKKQDKVNDLLNLINEEQEIIDKKFKLISVFERPTIALDEKEIYKIRENTIKNIEKFIQQKSLGLNIDENVVEPPIFSYSYDNVNNLDLNKKFVKIFQHSYPQLKKNIYLNSNIKSDKIKIGFISEFFNRHTIEKLFKGIISNLSNQYFDIKVFYLNKNGNKTISNDFFKYEITSNIENIELPKFFDDKINLIKNQNLDILFYPDVGLSAEFYYLTFLRLAKKQYTSWGHPETTCIPTIDYFLSSKLLEVNYESSQKHYTEKLLLSDYLPMFYFKPNLNKTLDNDDLMNNNIYSCPQTLFKLHPNFDEVIIKILKQDLKSKIYLIEDSGKIYSKKLFERIKKKSSFRLENLIFINKLKYNEYIEHCGRSSVLLDPFFFGAGNSFHESMFYGTMTVTMPSNFLKSRIVLGAYKQMKIQNPPVVENIDNYINTAIEIANMKKRDLLEKKIYFKEAAEKNLFENKLALKSIENFFIESIN